MVLRKPLLLLLQLLAARQIADQSAPQWDYRDTNRWIADYPICGGSQQSPINLDHYTSIGSLKPALKFRNYAQPFAGQLTLVNNGHTADIVLPETVRGPRPTITGGLLDGVYEAQSVHFHWGAPGGARGSEHTVNGYRYDVEIHIVHKNMKYGNAQEAMQHPDGLAVLAVMINIVDIPQTYYPGLNIVFNSLPRVRAANTNTTIINQLSLNHFLGDVDTRNFFAYRGSLTTPPCSEAVTWHVFPRPLLISREMIQRFFELRQTNGAPLWNNYRPLQALNRRQVYRRKGGI